MQYSKAAYAESISNKNAREYIEDLRERMKVTQDLVKQYTTEAQRKTEVSI